MHRITLRVSCTMWEHQVSFSDQMWEPLGKFRPGFKVDSAPHMRPVTWVIIIAGIKLSLMTMVNRQLTDTINLIGENDFIGKVIQHLIMFGTFVHLGPLGEHTIINLVSANVGADVALGTNKRT